MRVASKRYLLVSDRGATCLRADLGGSSNYSTANIEV